MSKTSHPEVFLVGAFAAAVTGFLAYTGMIDAASLIIETRALGPYLEDIIIPYATFFLSGLAFIGGSFVGMIGGMALDD